MSISIRVGMRLSPQYVTSVRSIGRVNDGPVSATLRITADAPGCYSLVHDITVYKGINRADIRNIVDKIDNREHERVRFAFPFSINNAETVIDLTFWRDASGTRAVNRCQ